MELDRRGVLLLRKDIGPRSRGNRTGLDGRSKLGRTWPATLSALLESQDQTSGQFFVEASRHAFRYLLQPLQNVRTP